LTIAEIFWWENCPIPKAQIEQITIGLIYKFMDDMDKEAIELGGQSKFFSDYKVPDPQFPNDRSKDKRIEFSKYAWDNLMNPKVTAVEMLTLYAEAIEGMEKNPNIPQLFRDIFKNAYLPYRSAETLKLFLKTIGEFEYTHSEKLGDAFEYLLSVMGSQGDAGQFRTPRHIIDFLVAIIDPEKTDSILDPACGTAGFLISAYKHILLKNTRDNKQGLNIYEYNILEKKPFNNLGDRLTPDERKKLIQNFTGYDISPDMVRLSLVNLYLHGFNTPNIHEYDTLSSEERWNDSFDVVLANPPFMSPKGGIRPHKKFTISSNRSEVLFVDYIAEHLNLNGKAGIIVPEGIIFQSGTSYKDLRKMLVEKHLYAVVSLPAGVFNPYSGVKTSILLMDKEVAKKREEILFIKIDNDGYNLGAQRTAVKGGQLQEAIQLAHKFVETGEFEETTIAHLVAKAEIAKNGDFNLSGERYKIAANTKTEFPLSKLSEVVDLVRGITFSKNDQLQEPTSHSIKVATTKAAQEEGIVDEALYNVPRSFLSSNEKLLIDGDILMSTANSLNLLGRVTYVNGLKDETTFGAFMTLIRPKKNSILPKLLFQLLKSNNAKVYYIANANTTTNISNLKFEDLNNMAIPLPPLSIQEEIVAEIEGYQKIIDGAKAVVANYKPKIDIDPDWEMVELGEVCDFIRGPFGGSLKKEIFVETGYAVYEQSHAIYNQFENFRYFVDESKFNEMKRFEVCTNDLIMSCSGTMGKVSIVPENAPKGIINQALLKLSTHSKKLLTVFLKLWMDSE
jgi:type I restriction enzyme M protein